MGAPRVVAKGTDRLAMRIRDLARDAGVPVLEAPPLARALYTHVEIDGEVPAMLFAAVAQVLAWVYQLRAAPEPERARARRARAARTRSAHRRPPSPSVVVPARAPRRPPPSKTYLQSPE